MFFKNIKPAVYLSCKYHRYITTHQQSVNPELHPILRVMLVRLVVHVFVTYAPVMSPFNNIVRYMCTSLCYVPAK